MGVRILRDEIRREYTDVAVDPERGYHFNTGQAGFAVTGYAESAISAVPPAAASSFAGMGNPFAAGDIDPGSYVVDVGSGAGADCFIAASMTGPDGFVIGVDMTDAMVSKARAAARSLEVENVEFREGFAENLPIPDAWADVVISNGVVNLSPSKARVFEEMYRVLRPGGRIQICDIFVERPVPEGAKGDIDLWTN